METINHECYVSPEVAKLLKEAGFDWETANNYDLAVNSWQLFFGYGTQNHNKINDCYSAPTLAVAQRWLREVKECFVDIETHNSDKLFFVAFFKTPITGKFMQAICNDNYNAIKYISYEEALEAGIKKCLEII